MTPSVERPVDSTDREGKARDATTPTSRFSEAAREARVGTPRGVSRREGSALIALAVVQFVGTAVMFQALNLPWGGIVRMATQVLVLLGIVVIALVADRFRGVHPFGFRRAYWAAFAWALLMIVVAGWFWIAQAPHNAPAVLTTAAAFVGWLPFALVGVRLARAAR